jgi:hypothetical protein
MRIRTKIGLLVGGLLATQAATLAASGYLLVNQAHASQQLVTTSTSELALVSSLNRAYMQEAAAFDAMVIHAGHQQNGVSEFADRLDTYREASAEAAFLAAGAADEVSNSTLRSEIEQFQQIHDEATSARTEQVNLLKARAYDPDADHEANTLSAKAQQVLDGALADAQANARASALSQTRANQRLVTWAGLLAGVLLAVVAAISVLVVRRIVQPIRRLTEGARSTATSELPEAVAAIRQSTGAVRAPALAPISSGTSGDELELLAHAMNSVRNRAVSLAVEQREADIAASETLVNLGRRNQSLLNRTLSYVAALERDERDPKVLSQLFRLDHLTTRVRRNAESMLVLAGAEQGRPLTRPVPVADVVRASLSEIEDYARVNVRELEPVAVIGSAAADLSHLLAELLENGTRFSAQETTVTVEGVATEEGYRLSVSDAGLGMTVAELVAANRQIAEADRPSGQSPWHHRHPAPGRDRWCRRRRPAALRDAGQDGRCQGPSRGDPGRHRPHSRPRGQH